MSLWIFAKIVIIITFTTLFAVYQVNSGEWRLITHHLFIFLFSPPPPPLPKPPARKKKLPVLFLLAKHNCACSGAPQYFRVLSPGASFPEHQNCTFFRTVQIPTPPCAPSHLYTFLSGKPGLAQTLKFVDTLCSIYRRLSRWIQLGV